MNGIDQKLETARQELLDLGLRNKLINYKLLKTRGVEVVDELPKQVYKMLVENERQMSFLPAPDLEEEENENEEQVLLFEQPEEEEQTGSVAARHTDNKLQTDHISAQLQRRLLNTYYTARTHIEEQGVNVLFLALGLVEWYESDNSELKRQAPLILIPVSLERPSVQSRFYLKYTGDDVGGNLSLQAKFASDEVGIDLPLPGDQDIDVQGYFSKVAAAIEDKPRWSVDTSAIVLGFFSFAKFLMYNDLDSSTWPSDSSPSQHHILEALMESGFGSSESTIGDDEHIDQYVDLEKVYQVVDADSSQTVAILDVNKGKNLVIQGPPGTGKSQTITNLIAEAIGNGKKILFVAEKMAALEVVKRNLDKIGLGDACLELHSHKSNKKAVLDELRRITQLGKPHLLHNGQDLEVLKKNRDRLNRYCEAVNTPIGESQVTPYYAFGILLNLKRHFQDISLPDYDDSRLSQFSGSQFQQNLAYIEELQALLSRIGIPSEHLFWGCKCKVFLPDDQSQFKNASQRSLDLINDLIASIHSLSNELAIAIPADKTELEVLLTAAHRVDNAPDLSGVSIKDSDWLSQRDELQKGLNAGERIQTLHTEFDGRLIPEAWGRDVVGIRQSLSTYVEELKVILSRAGIPEGTIQRTQDLINDIIESAQSISDELAIPIPTDQKELEMLLAVANKANNAPDLSGVAIKDSDWLSQREKLQKGLKAGERVRSLHVEFDSRLIPEAWDQNGVEIRITLLAYVKELKALLSHAGMLEDTIQRTQDLISDITESVQSISDELAMSFPANRNELEMLIAVANKANQAPDLSGVSIKDSDWLSQREKLLKGLKAGERIQSLHIEYDSKLIPEAWGQDVISMRKILAVYGPKWWRFLSGEYRSAKNELVGFCKRGLPNQLNGQLELIDAVLETKRLEPDVLEVKDVASRLFGGLWKAENSDWNRLQEIAHYLGEVYNDVEGNRLLSEIIDYLALNKDSESLKEKVNRTESLVKGYEAEYGSRWWEFLSKKNRRNNAQLAGLCKEGLPKTLDEQIEIANAIWEANQLNPEAVEVEDVAKKLFGGLWKAESSDWKRLQEISHYLGEVYSEVEGSRLLREIINYLALNKDSESLKEKVSGAESLVKYYEAEYGSRWWSFLSEKNRRNNTELAGLCKQGLPQTLGEQIEIVDAIWEINQLKSVVIEVDGPFNRLFGDHWKAENPDWNRLRTISHYLSELHRDVGGNDLVENILDFLVSNNDYGNLTQEVIRAESLVQDCEIAANRAIEIIQIDKTEHFGNDEIYITQSYESQRQMCQSWISNIESIQDMVSYNHHRENLKNNGLNGIIEISNGWSEAGMHLTNFFKYNWYNSLITRAINERTDLARFDCATHQTVIDKFRELDEVTLRHNRGQLASKHWEYIPKQNSGSGQLGILQHEFEKKRRHLPIRQLINHTGNVIQAIKPVFMMSPLSIATFLPPESASFDIVVFDEASQVKPVDAFGAILRASQAVVVGDSKQLPPTNFFNVIAETDGEDDEDLGINTADMESILGLFCAQDAPQRMLRWHYRSRHESLIAVSNYEFYDNKLQLFPSPDAAKVEVGLIYHLLSDSAYEPGKNARNPKEAMAVAKAVMKHARENPEQTLGVATFSMSQMQEVQDQLEILRRQNPDCEIYFSKHSDEPFFVKNLENVQGDERDVIFISVGYGRTADGRLSMNFGPLNQEGGERRLNVLITRAKRRCEVFTNLTGDDIDLGKTKARGVVALKRYLNFAQTGELDIAVPTGKGADSPFEEAVADALRDAGYRIEHQVGVGGFFIDLAVVDEQRPGRYMLGIECDGASYHSARSARDRDRLRQQVLEGMGWQIHRIWSTDWFKRPESELRRAVEAIEKAKVQIAPVPPINHDIGGFTIERSDHIPPDEGVESEKYQMSDLEIDLGDYDLHEVPRSTLTDWIEEIVQIEWPIHFDDLINRIREAAGLGRAGVRIRSALDAAVISATRTKNVRKKRQFLWVKNQEEPTVRDRSDLPVSSRKLEFVSPEEIEAAVKTVIENAMGMSASDIPQASCKLFGFKAVSEEMRQMISRIVNSMVHKGKLVQQGDFLVVAD
jgi:very-short-patch-repair endonuclease